MNFAIILKTLNLQNIWEWLLLMMRSSLDSFVRLLLIKMENKRMSKIIASEKWLCIFFNISNKSKDNDRITIILTVQTPVFF